MLNMKTPFKYRKGQIFGIIFFEEYCSRRGAGILFHVLRFQPLLLVYTSHCTYNMTEYRLWKVQTQHFVDCKKENSLLICLVPYNVCQQKKTMYKSVSPISSSSFFGGRTHNKKENDQVKEHVHIRYKLCINNIQKQKEPNCKLWCT